MKISAIYKSGQTESGAPGILVWPDSVWLKNGKPMFLPDEDETYHVILALCLRIDKVGKSVAEKFAHRYYREAAYSAILLGRRPYEALKNGSDPLACDICTDCCILTGNFIDKTIWRDIKNINLTISPLLIKERTFQEEISLAFDAEKFQHSCDEAIAAASVRNTLKTGDLIFPSLPTEGFEAKLDTKMEVKGDGSELLRFNIK